MASFTFNQTSGTQLPTIDAKWTVYDGGTGKVFQTNGTYLTVSAIFAVPVAAYVNGHGAAQLSRITAQAGANVADTFRASCQVRSNALSGYEMYLTSSTDWQVRRDTVFVTNGTHAENVTSANFTLEISVDGAGLVVGKINGNTYYSGTDGTPLTGGYPGFDGHDSGSLTGLRILDWTDGVVAGPEFTQQPAAQQTTNGGTATFTVSATSLGSGLAYQWQDNRSGSFANVSDGSGATTTAYTTATTTPSFQGRQYRVVATDSNGTTNSASATLGLVDLPIYLWSTSVQSGNDVWLRDPTTFASTPPSTDGTAEAWDWSIEDAGFIDDTIEIDARSQYLGDDAVAAPDAIPQDDFTAEDGYDDPTTDLVEAASAPVQANAPPLDALQNDPWPWATDDDVSDDWQQDAYSFDADPIVDDAWPWSIEDDAADLWPLDDALPTDPIAADQAQDDAPEFQDVDDELTPESSPVGPDQPPVVEDPWIFEEFGDEADQAIEQSAGVVDNEPALPAESCDEPDLDDEPWWFDLPALGADFIAPQDAQAQADPEADDVADELVDESAPVGPDAAPDQPQLESWLEEDASDDILDESAPVGQDVAAAPDQTQSEPWVEEEAHDEFQDESAPVGADTLALEQPQASDWLDEDTQDDLPDESAPVADGALAASQDWDWSEDALDDFQDDAAQLVDLTVADQPADAPFFEDELDDLAPADDFLNENAPDQPPADAWWWDEEPADDDFWWQTIDYPLVDLVLLPGLPYGEDWDWNGEDTEDDSHWFELPEPDPAGLPADTCPAQLAAAMALIADLQAQLAAALANAGGGGGGAGGDGDDNIGVHSREEDIQDRLLAGRRTAKRARIAQQNALIMALCGAVVHGLKGPREPK